jgi:hypothetical protein
LLKVRRFVEILVETDRISPGSAHSVGGDSSMLSIVALRASFARDRVVVEGVGGWAKMSTLNVVDEVHTSKEGGRTRRLRTVSLAAPLGVDLVAGFIAWKLVRPGESLLWPTLLIALIMSAPAGGCYLAIKSMGGWKSHRSLAVSVVALCVFPILWSFLGVLPASVSWNSTAASWIHTSIQDGAQGCRIASTGSVGFLIAPYKVCVTQAGTSSMVMFSTVDGSRGYAYVQGKSDQSWFPDQCAMELLSPHWWAFYIKPVQNVNGCPFGYLLHGAG